MFEQNTNDKDNRSTTIAGKNNQSYKTCQKIHTHTHTSSSNNNAKQSNFMWCGWLADCIVVLGIVFKIIHVCLYKCADVVISFRMCINFQNGFDDRINIFIFSFQIQLLCIKVIWIVTWFAVVVVVVCYYCFVMFILSSSFSLLSTFRVTYKYMKRHTTNSNLNNSRSYLRIHINNSIAFQMNCLYYMCIGKMSGKKRRSENEIIFTMLIALLCMRARMRAYFFCSRMLKSS